jgi:glycosyltransferase involved in cell wall biosynthesis
VKTADSIAFVCPRFAAGGAVGGAETLLRNQAARAAAAGRRVTFLTTCARSHFSWANELPPGERTVDGMTVRFFPVSPRDEAAFLDAQRSICAGGSVLPGTESAWLANSVHSEALYEHLASHGAGYDRIVMGPYLFGLTYRASEILPDRTVLVPCLHDEPFATLEATRALFHRVRAIMFNSAPEQALAERLFGTPLPPSAVVGMGMDDFAADGDAFRKRHAWADVDYLIYCGRREPMKGTTLLLDYLGAFRRRTGRDVRLVLTGSGPVELPGELAGAVTDLGFVSESEKHDAMAGALAFAHPSVNESLGIVLLESWLAGTPALVHACSAVLRDQCKRSRGGLWFRIYPEFEETLLWILDRPALRRQMGTAGRRFVLSEYSWAKTLGRMLSLLDEAG